MRTLNDKEKRTVRLGGIVLGAYLVLFYGSRGVMVLEGMRTEVLDRFRAAELLKSEADLEETRHLHAEKLKAELRIDLAALKDETVVGEASAAVQKAVQEQGLQLGPTKETRKRSTEREMGTIQIDGQGGATAAAQFISGLGTIGYPLVVDSISFKGGQNPGQVSFSLSISVLNFNFGPAKTEEKSGA
jgi:hypothetical protein